MGESEIEGVRTKEEGEREVASACGTDRSARDRSGDAWDPTETTHYLSRCLFDKVDPPRDEEEGISRGRKWEGLGA
jgi:hypothetical protein